MANLKHLPLTRTELRVTRLADGHLELGRELNLDAALSDCGVSSVDAFVKEVGEAFGASIPAEAVAEFRNARELAAYLDSLSRKLPRTGVFH